VGSMLAAVLAIWAICALAPAAGAHGRSSSSSAWQFEPGPVADARVVVRVRLTDVHQAVPEAAGLTAAEIRVRPAAAAALDAYLVRHVTLRVGDSPCPVRGGVRVVPSADPAHLARSWRIRCREPSEIGGPVMQIDAFLEVAPGHFHLARVTRADGESLERLFVLDRPRQSLGAPEAPTRARGAGFGEYLVLGVEHIATGLDHLVFLLALLVVGVSLWEVATIVTGFTLAHSVTLALGVLGVVEPRPSAIEALIGLSIVVVAVENFWFTAGATTRRGIGIALGGGVGLAAAGALAGRVAVPALALVGVGLFALCYLALLQHVERPRRMRWFLAFVFGLVHGFGFAGMLVEIGLPGDRLAAALLGFNLGVELGQLVIVAAVWPLLAVLLRGDALRRRRIVHAFSAPILAAGLYWFLTRALAF